MRFLTHTTLFCLLITLPNRTWMIISDRWDSRFNFLRFVYSSSRQLDSPHLYLTSLTVHKRVTLFFFFIFLFRTFDSLVFFHFFSFTSFPSILSPHNALFNFFQCNSFLFWLSFHSLSLFTSFHWLLSLLFCHSSRPIIFIHFNSFSFTPLLTSPQLSLHN